MIRELRTGLSKTQDQFGGELAVSGARVSAYENGEATAGQHRERLDQLLEQAPPEVRARVEHAEASGVEVPE